MSSLQQSIESAKTAFEAGENFNREGANLIAFAQRLGATQRRIAEGIGRSAPWVNQVLKWRERGFVGTPFGPQSKTKRERPRHVQAPEQAAQVTVASPEPFASAPNLEIEPAPLRAQPERPLEEVPLAPQQSQVNASETLQPSDVPKQNAAVQSANEKAVVPTANPVSEPTMGKDFSAEETGQLRALEQAWRNSSHRVRRAFWGRITKATKAKASSKAAPSVTRKLTIPGKKIEVVVQRGFRV